MQIELTLKKSLAVAGVLVLLVLGFAIYHTVSRRAYESQIVDLQNKVAVRDKTIEVKDGVYEKLAIQTKDLEKLLGDKDTEIGRLKEQLDDQGAQLLTANTLNVRLRNDLIAARENVPVTTPDPAKPGIKRMEIDTEDNFDPFQVFGEVRIDCDTSRGSANLRMGQRSPISFSVVVSQDKDGTWRSTATSSTKTFEVDITLAAVNPYMLEPRWFEKIGLGVDIGVGTNPGFLMGLGAYYQIGRFEVGPRAWMVVDRGVSAYFGAQLLWHPFAK